MRSTLVEQHRVAELEDEKKEKQAVQVTDRSRFRTKQRTPRQSSQSAHAEEKVLFETEQNFPSLHQSPASSDNECDMNATFGKSTGILDK